MSGSLNLNIVKIIHFMKKLLLIFVLTLIYSSIIAQNRVSGVVIDETGEPLPGVTVIEKGINSTKQNGTITDLNGKFSLIAKQPQGILSFSFIGLKTITHPFNGNETIKITMMESKTDLDEVVVLGYGSQKKVSVTGAISTVTT